MPIDSSHNFTPEEIQLIERQYVEKMEDGRKFRVYLTLADVRDALARFSVDKEGSAKVELVPAISIALKVLSDQKLILESYLDNDVSDEEARPQEKLSGADEAAD